MTRHVVELVVDIAGHGKVLLDGKPLKGVTSVNVYANVNNTTEVNITLLPEKVLANLDALVNITHDDSDIEETGE